MNEVTAEVNLTSCRRCGGVPRLGAHGVGHDQLYDRALYDQAAEAWARAREAHDAAQRAWSLASDRFREAESALADQELQPGIPGYVHLELCPTAAACRLDYCPIHEGGHRGDPEF